ncbi:unnamed protein product [Calypogeia fissa]
MTCLALLPSSPAVFCVQLPSHGSVSSSQCRQQVLTSSRCSSRESTFSCRAWKTQRVCNDFSGFVPSNPSRLWKPRSFVPSNCVACTTSSQNEVGVDNACGPASKPANDYTVREANLDEELWAAAWIRAESYCEEQPYVRYIESYKKRFAEQEFDALKRRLLGKYGQSIRCICLVAVSGRSSQNNTKNGTQSATVLDRVVGTLDLSVRQLSHGETFPGDSIRATLSVGAPGFRGSHQYGYIANVCVTKAARQNGIGSSLLRMAINAGKDWGLKELYVHVNSTNIAAQRLYNKFKFKRMQAGAVEVGVHNIILLQLLL